MVKIGSGVVVGQFEDVPIRQRLAPQYLMVFFQRWAGAVGVSAVCIRVEIKRGIDDGLARLFLVDFVRCPFAIMQPVHVRTMVAV